MQIPTYIVYTKIAMILYYSNCESFLMSIASNSPLQLLVQTLPRIFFLRDVNNNYKFEYSISLYWLQSNMAITNKL